MNRLALQAAMPLWLVPPATVYLPFDPGFFERLPLYDYQLRMLLELVEHIRAGRRRILLQLPTGGGKTFLATALLGSASAAQFIVHRKELIEQTSRAFWRAGIAHSFVAADKPMDLDAAVLLCGIATLAKRMGVVLPPDMIVVDEAHHVVANSWREVVDANPDAIIVGLTATPERLDGKGLGEFFEVMVLGPPPAELIARGFLSPFDYYAPSRPDMTGVGTVGGDWNKAGAAAAMDRPTLIGDMVEHYLRLAAGQPGIVFAASREHSRNLVEAFRGNGVRAIHVDGSMSAKERERADAMFKARDVDLMSNVDLFGEGYDVPGIVYTGLGRPSKSQAIIRQQWGRNLRAVYAPGMPLATDADRLAAIAAGPKQRGIMCDHAGNWQTIGALPDWDYPWDLGGRVKGAKGAGCNDDADPIHQCAVCYRVTPSIVRVCPGCGHEFPVQQRVLRQEAGTLSKLEREEVKRIAEQGKKDAERARKAEQRACANHMELVDLARSRGYKNPDAWARMQMKFRSNWKGG